MDNMLQILSIISLAVLLFFGPVIVIVSLIGNAQIGPVKIDLRSRSTAVRTTLAAVGLLSWLLLYIPLAISAFRDVEKSATPNGAAENTTEESVTPPINLNTQAARSVGKNIFDVSPTLGWQDTKINIKSGAKIHIYVISGEWTRWLGHTPYVGGEGDVNYVCGKIMYPAECSEPLPTSPAGTLIGQIGDMMFEIGSETTIIATDKGNLYLRINDADSGLFDNDGSLQVQVKK